MKLAVYLSIVSNKGDYKNPPIAYLKAIINIYTLNNVYAIVLPH
jgi:hypothetical protein